jgi:hypothetical protein
VLWKGFAQRYLFVKETGTIQAKGWDILETREEKIPSNFFPVHGGSSAPPYLMVHFTLRRTEVKTVETPPEFCGPCYIQHPLTSD